jgi:hypothetical protein
VRSNEQVGVMRKAIVQSSQLNASLHTQLRGFIVGMPESIHRFRNRSLVGRLYGRLEVDGCYEYCKRSQQEPSSLGYHVPVDHERRMDQLRVCSTSIGRLNSVQ